ncbi:MAG: hypothetical protein V1672_01235 [Candidatus Diapherotrites archaeon]
MIFDKLFAMFGKIFSFMGSKEPKTQNLKISELSSKIEKTSSVQEKQANQYFASKASEIKHILNVLRKSLEDIENAEIPEGRARITKVVGTSKIQMIRQVNALIDKIEVPNNIDVSSMKEYCINAHNTLNNESSRIVKNTAYTGILMKEHVSKIGNYFKELNENFSEMKKYLEENDAVFLSIEANQISNLINEKRSILLECNKNKETLTNELNALLQNKKSLLNEIEELESSPEMDEYEGIKERKAALYKEKQNLKTRIIDLMSNVDKPLKRFQKLTEINEIIISSELKESLKHYLSNSFYALKTDQKAENLKAILAEVIKAIELDIITFKDSKEKEKKISAINELINFDFFENVFWELNKLEIEIHAIEKQESESAITEKINNKLMEKNQIEKEIEDRGFSLSKIKEDCETTEENISSLKNKLEETGKSILGFEINIID